MATDLISTICIIQMFLLLALTAHDVLVRRRQIWTSLCHKGWIASTHNRVPLLRQPAFGGDVGAIVYLLPERDAMVRAEPQLHVA